MTAREVVTAETKMKPVPVNPKLAGHFGTARFRLAAGLCVSVAVLAAWGWIRAQAEPRIAGYESVGFSTLGSFMFDPPQDVLFAKSNLTAVGARLLTLVPEPIRALDGHRIATRGFVMPTRLVEGRAVEFLLLRDRSLCCFGVTPQFNQWNNVHVAPPGVRVALDVPTTVCGTLHVGDFREGGYLVGIYDLKADQVLSESKR